MMQPVITALSAYVPPIKVLNDPPKIEGANVMATLNGWDAWIASWRATCAFDPAATACANSEARQSDRSWRIPVEGDVDLSGLAVRVAQTIFAARHSTAAPVDIIMFCHSSVDQHISTTTAGRLANIAGRSCFSFSVSQQYSASAFTALRLAQDLLIAEPHVHTVLIVAAEKWAPPFSRCRELGPPLGDAAAALLLERPTATTRGFRLVDAHTCHCPISTRGAPHRHAHPDFDQLHALLQMTDSLLAKHAILPREVSAIGPAVDPALGRALRQRLGIATLTHRPPHDAHLGAAAPIEQLAYALEARALPSQRAVLIWDIGLYGYVGCALLDAHTAHGTPTLARAPDWSTRW